MIQRQCGMRNVECGISMKGRGVHDTPRYIPHSEFRISNWIPAGRKEPGLFVELHRGTVLESRHRVHVAVVDASGRLVAQAGDPDYRTFWRSAAKPFQALPLVE